MRSAVLSVTQWVFARLAGQADREWLSGDLEEEYSIRAKADSSAATRWLLWQTLASIPPLLGLRLARLRWLATLGIGMAAYTAVGVVQLIIDQAWVGLSAMTHNPLIFAILLPTVVLIGYCAERLQRGAALVLGALMLLAMTALTLWSSEIIPLWYRAAYFCTGPAGALLGCVLRHVTTSPTAGRSLSR